MQLSVDQCPDGSPTHCTLVACYWVQLLIWDRGLHSCSLGQCYSAFSSPSKLQLQLSIQHSKPKAGNWLSEVKLCELSTETGWLLTETGWFVLCSILCVYVRSGQIQAREWTTPLCSVSYPYIKALIDAKRLLVSCPSFLPQPLPSLFIASSCSSFHSFFTSLLPPPSYSTTKLLTEAWSRARLQLAGCHRLTDYVTTH